MREGENYSFQSAKVEKEDARGDGGWCALPSFRFPVKDPRKKTLCVYNDLA